jgi:hypothetical protein
VSSYVADRRKFGGAAAWDMPEDFLQAVKNICASEKKSGFLGI